MLAGFGEGRAYAGAESDRVGQVKAAVILNIAKFVGWPSGSAALSQRNFMLCYYRADVLGPGVDIILNKRVMGRPLVKKLIENLEQSESCGVLLIPESELDHFIAESSEQPEATSVLTIADLTSKGSKGVAYPGVIMNFVRRDTSIGFEVNPGELEERGLSMSSELLKLAHIVKASEER
ncbi:YfiR family protein [Marinobacterium sp. YM272]|uniref:YfiR family protein n=1 Tax=Marinobacterium sp. YM272 TaxID=3421654 RepID=UPI003D7FCBD7